MKTTLFILCIMFATLGKAQIAGVTFNPPKAGIGIFTQIKLSEKMMLYADFDYGKYKPIDIEIFKPGAGLSYRITHRSFLTAAISYNYVRPSMDIYKVSPQVGGIVIDNHLSFMVMVDPLNWEAKVGIGFNF